jgi:hypothetical protein
MWVSSHIGHHAEDGIQINFVVFGSVEDGVHLGFESAEICFERNFFLLSTVWFLVGLFPDVLFDIEETLQVAQSVVQGFLIELGVDLSLAASNYASTVDRQVASRRLAGWL